MKKPITLTEFIIRAILVAGCAVAIALQAGCASVKAEIKKPDGTVVNYSSNRLLLKQDTTASMETNGAFNASSVQEQVPDAETVSVLSAALLKATGK